MEFAINSSLYQYLNSKGKLTEQETAKVIIFYYNQLVNNDFKLKSFVYKLLLLQIIYIKEV